MRVFKNKNRIRCKSQNVENWFWSQNIEMYSNSGWIVVYIQVNRKDFFYWQEFCYEHSDLYLVYTMKTGSW